MFRKYYGTEFITVKLLPLNNLILSKIQLKIIIMAFLFPTNYAYSLLNTVLIAPYETHEINFSWFWSLRSLLQAQESLRLSSGALHYFQKHLKVQRRIQARRLRRKIDNNSKWYGVLKPSEKNFQELEVINYVKHWWWAKEDEGRLQIIRLDRWRLLLVHTGVVLVK